MAEVVPTGAVIDRPAHSSVTAVTTGLSWCWPFVVLLPAIAVLPPFPRRFHWWEFNKNKLAVSVCLAVPVCACYFLRPGTIDGTAAVAGLSRQSIAGDAIPFMVLLFALCIMGRGVRLNGGIPARPATNAAFLPLAAVPVNIIGTTGASMRLIRSVRSMPNMETGLHTMEGLMIPHLNTNRTETEFTSVNVQPRRGGAGE